MSDFSSVGFYRSTIVTAVAAVLLGALMLAPPTYASDTQNLWQSLQSGGHVVLIRHAIAPGTGDPDTFDVNDCSTQRVLSQEGHQQSDRIGTLFRDNGIQSAQVYSSQWCRCLETARGLSLGAVQEMTALNSFFQNRGMQGPQTQALRKWLREAPLTQPTVLVTHQVNITALTGHYPQSGELIFLRVEESGDVVQIGTIQTR
jgi:phosphohistidine phosphatase SixA